MAEEIGVSFKDILLDSARDVRDKSPSAYGTFSLIYNGKLIGDQFLNKEALILKIAAVNQG
jgi:hypothetical protein